MGATLALLSHFFLRASLARARVSTDHFLFFKREPRQSLCFYRSDRFFFCLQTLMTLTTPVHSEFLSCSQTKRTHVLLAFSHTYVLLASDFQELGHRVMTICLLTEVKWQWAMLVLGWVTVSVQDQLWDVSKLEFLSVTRLS